MRAQEFITERKRGKSKKSRKSARVHGPFWGWWGGTVGSGEDGASDGGGVEEGMISDDYNPATVRPGFKKEKLYKDRYLLRAEAVKMDKYDVGRRERGLMIEVFDSKNPGDLIAYTKLLVSKLDMIPAATWVKPQYQRQGIASAMYNFARELGNDIIPSSDQTADAEAFWAAGAGLGRAK